VKKAVPTKIDYFNEQRTLLTLYAAYWGIDDYFDRLAEAASTGSIEDTQMCARRMQLELPEIRAAKTSGYYILEKIGYGHG
jgi:hypothetical protein